MSTIQNLNQTRARHALQFAKAHEKLDPKTQKLVTTIAGDNGGEVVKKIPPAIMNNGLLAALAYSMDAKQASWKEVFNGIAEHLSSSDVAIVPAEKNTAEELLDFLTAENTSSAKLRDATDEAMLWLEFARRFV